MAVNKVIYGGETIVDLTNDTVTPETLAEGAVAHDASGERITGTMPITTVLYTEQSLSNEQKSQARENIGALAESELQDGINTAKQEIKDALGNEYIQKFHGVANTGKILMVDANGMLTLAEVPELGLQGDIVGVVSENNEIVLTGALPEGIYTIKYESEDGELQEIGTINLESETVVPLNLNLGKIDYNNNGVIVTSDTYLYSDLFDTGYQYYVSFVGEGCQCSIKIAYYDENDAYIGISNYELPNYSEAIGTGSWSIVAPSNVAKLRLRVYHRNTANVSYSLSNMVLTRRKINYTNVLPTALSSTGSVLDGVGYVNDKKLHNYPERWTDCVGYFSTGWFPYTIAQARARIPLYVKGVTIDLASLDGNLMIGMAVEATTKEWMGAHPITDMSVIDQCTIVQLGEKYYVIIPNSNMRTAQGWSSKDMKYMRLSLPGSGEGVIITVDEPIE
jgi:hypothetical protein